MTDLRALLRQFEVAENSNDPAAIVSAMADDVVMIVPDYGVQEGRGACEQFLRDLLAYLHANFDRRIAYESAEVHEFGDHAYDRGTFQFTVAPRGGGTAETVTGKYFWLYARAGDEWRLWRAVIVRDE